MSTAARMAPDFSAVPADLTELDSWLVWRYMTRDGRQTKVPYSVVTGRPASSTDPATWCSFERSVEAFANGNYVGIGFVFSADDPYIGIDLDKCLTEDRGVKPWAQPIIERLSDSYAEVSPSGRGLKFWLRGRVPAESGKKWTYPHPMFSEEGEGIEMYDHGRYFTVTGAIPPGGFSQIEEHQSDVDWLYGVMEGQSADDNHVNQGFTNPSRADLTTTAKVPGGQRHNFLVSLAAQFRHRGMEPDEIFAAVQTINQTRCNPPKSEDEVRKIVYDWVAKKPAGPSRRALPTPVQAIDTRVPEYAGNERWREYLITSNAGVVKPVLGNAITGLRMSPEWAGAIGYDEFAGAVVVRRPILGIEPGTRWNDHCDRIACEWLHRELIFVSIGSTNDAVLRVAFEQPFHPVREWISTLRWDGQPRIDHWLSDYLGVINDEYTRAVGSRWLISAVARIFQPGCKADCALILEGEQGARKSTAVRILGGKWFTDEIADLGGKDAAMQMHGAWIIEIAELDSMSRTEVGKIKAFMSRTLDRFRPPYGRALIESARQCVFVGTVNHSTYLRDETGGRRFWPVRCGSIRPDELERDREQLWAETVARYEDGCIWWIDEPHLMAMAAEEQAQRYEGDPWENLIAEWCKNPEEKYDEHGHPVAPLDSTAEMVRMDDIMHHCIGRQVGFWSKMDRNRVSAILRGIGYRPVRMQVKGHRESVYRLVGPVA